VVRAVLDACVLYSAALRDLFMRLTVIFAFQPVWTETIQDEWMRHVLINRPDLTRAQIERTQVLMERYGRDWQAPGYEQYLPVVTLPDENDRHVVAAAIAGDAPVIVTFNLSDFPATALAAYGIEAQHPDAFLCRLFDEEPALFIGAVRDLLAGLKNPPRTLTEELDILRAQGLTETATRLRSRATAIEGATTEEA
jgi:hypothetical protein